MAGSKRTPRPERPSGAACPVAQTLNDFLRQRLIAGGRLGVALSGGLDSLVLLHALHALRSHLPPMTLSALHVHHGLSAHADDWAAFCADFCASLAVPLTIERISVPARSTEGPEAAARRLRHAVFAVYPSDWLALAHHRDDQSETVLFRLLRGAGVAGAAGMRAERPQSAGGPRLIRPLLSLPRATLAAYAQAQRLTWVEDESNGDCRYRRNFLRHELMPRANAVFSGAAGALARAAEHFAAATQLLDELAAIDRQAVIGQRGHIVLARFNALPAARADNLLRHEWCQAGFRAPETRWLAEARRQLAVGDNAAEICVATAEAELHVYRGEVYLVARRATSAPDSQPWAGESVLPWAGSPLRFIPAIGVGLSRRLLAQASCAFRARIGGEKLQPDPRRPRRSVRKLLQEVAVPPWERPALPFLWCGDRLAWVAGIGCDAAFACSPAEEGVEIVWDKRVTSHSVLHA